MKRVRLDSPHGRSVTEVLAALNVTFASGLSEHEAKHRLSFTVQTRLARGKGLG